MQSLLTLVLSHVALFAVISTQSGCTSNPFLAQTADRDSAVVISEAKRQPASETDSSNTERPPSLAFVQYQAQADGSIAFSRKLANNGSSAAWYEGDSSPWPGPQSPFTGPDNYQAGATAPMFEFGPGFPASYMEPSVPASAAQDAPALDPALVDSPSLESQADSPFSCGQRRFGRVWRRCGQFKDEVWADYQAFYCWPSLRNLFLGLGVGSILANTSMDQDFRDWYQERVHTGDLTRVAYGWKTFGEGAIFIPSYAALAVVGAMYDDCPWGGTIGEFGSRAARGFLVGGPVVLFGQYTLGAARPADDSENSHWQPFHSSHGVSGHAFVGALPFMTAAKMSENPWLKATLYGCSVFPAWSRVEHDRHYLSQAVLGWWIAYLACDAVDNSGQQERCYSITPVAGPDLVGVSFTCRL